VAALAEDVMAVASVVRRRRTTREVLETIRTEVGLGEAMAQLDRSKGEGSSQLDDLEALEQVADLHPVPETFEVWLRGLLSRPSDRDGITLATVHKVKGREWPNVIVYGATDGLLPHRLADDLEEERRVLHVGITRCRERVVIVADAGHPSPFLDELQRHRPAGAPEPTPGPRRAAPTAGPARTASPPAGDPDDPVFVALKGWRTEEARAAKVPPYVVFADKVLHEIAGRKPSSPRELAGISGIGPAKLERYGAAVLRVVAAVVAVSSGGDPAE
jgi:DNA helicase-2/ATP-dependent DNA helicase PcrA